MLVPGEFPVKWKHNGGNIKNASKIKVLKDSFYMGKRLIKLKIRQLGGGMDINDSGLDRCILGHN